MNVKDDVGKNIHKPLKAVVFRSLEQFSDSPFKRTCPECGGVIIMSRDQTTLKLERICYCFLCGQHYDIVDIQDWKRWYA